MIKRRLIAFSVVFLLVFLINPVSARGREFIVKPFQESIESVELGVSDEVVGNLSVSNGFIDFYITSPSGTILFCYNQTAFNTFSFTAEEKGVFTFHLANTYQTENVEVILNYGVNFKVVLQEQINFEVNLVTASTTSSIVPIIDWILILTVLSSISTLAEYVLKNISKILRWLHWKRKYGKPRTPIVVSPAVR